MTRGTDLSVALVIFPFPKGSPDFPYLYDTQEHRGNKVL